VDPADFGWLSGFVYVDQNNDGLRGGSETGIPIVTMTLSGTSGRGQTLFRTTVTDLAGFYLFDNLPPGSYTVTETQPAYLLDGRITVGWVDGIQTGIPSATDTIAQIALPRAGQGIEYNFAELLPASISGSVFRVDNQNLQPDEDTPGLSGVVVRLTGQNDRCGSVSRTATTDEAGNYTIANLRPGVYSVSLGPVGGVGSVHAQIGTLGGSVADMADITGIIVSSGTHGKKYDFAKINPAATSPGQREPEQQDELPEEDAGDCAPSSAVTDASCIPVSSNGSGNWFALFQIATATTVAVSEMVRKDSSRDSTLRSKRSVHCN
jgi:hypothetical protein